MGDKKTMDAKGLLEQILNAGRELAEQGQAYAQKRLDIPAEGAEREASLSGMSKGAAIAGVLALLLGTKAGRGITGAGLKLGTLAALGGADFKSIQAELRKAATDKSRVAFDLLRQKRTSDNVTAFGDFLMKLGDKVANAAKEGAFLGFGGERVSEEEQYLLAELGQTLGVHWA